MYFIGVFPLGLMALMLFSLLFSGARALIDMLPTLFYVFLVKNILIDVVFGLIKNKRSIFQTLYHLMLDFGRMGIFFYMLYLEAQRSSGFMGIINMVLLLCIAGVVFLMGEFTSINHGFPYDPDEGWFSILGELSVPVILIGLYFLFYG